jgi:hypothetical protein
MASGASATRGGRTSSEGERVRPTSSNSSIPRGKAAEAAFIRSDISRVTALITNSSVSRMLRSVSFSRP